MSWIGSGLILGGAMWVAAAKDTDTPDKKKRKEWAKEDIGFGGTEGATALVHAEGSTKRETYLPEEQQGLMTSHDDHENNEYSDLGAIESIELQDIDAESREQEAGI